jgi:hypothetical protein
LVDIEDGTVNRLDKINLDTLSCLSVRQAF